MEEKVNPEVAAGRFKALGLRMDVFCQMYADFYKDISGESLVEGLLKDDIPRGLEACLVKHGMGEEDRLRRGMFVADLLNHVIDQMEAKIEKVKGSKKSASELKAMLEAAGGELVGEIGNGMIIGISPKKLLENADKLPPQLVADLKKAMEKEGLL